MNTEFIVKYMKKAAAHMKKAVEFSQNKTVNLLKYSKSIMNSTISILNNLMSMVIKSKSPLAETFKTSLSVMLLSAGLIYAGFKAKQVIAPETESPIESPAGNQEGGGQSDDVEQQAGEQKIIFSDEAYKQCKANTLPSFINVSMSWGQAKYMAALKGYKSLSPPVVIVTAAGNSAGYPPSHPRYRALIDPNKERGSKEFDAILVGSVDPYADRSFFSQKGKEVAIVAPSDYTISSADKNGNYKRFGGTSGATPLVTGGLAGFSWLSGFQPTGEEAKILLEKTAIPTRLSNENPQMNGPGMLNAYKLGMVGKRLKELCGTDVYCFKNKIHEEATYEFPEDTTVFELADLAFPECSTDKCLEKSNSCQDKAEIFERMRKAAFLNPSNKEYWRYLSCVYASSGFSENAKGMRNIYNGLLGAAPAETGTDRVNTYVDKSCQVDEDCIFVPKCSFSYKNKQYYPHEIFFTSANKDYVTECQGSVLCEGACRCAEQKKQRKGFKYIGEGDNKKYTSVTLQLRCVDSQCIEEEFQAEADTNTGTGQR